MQKTMENSVGSSKILLGLKNSHNNSNKAHDSEFAALFYIRNINIELGKDLDEVILILKGLEDLNKKSKQILDEYCIVTERALYDDLISSSDLNLKHIGKQFRYLKANITEKINLNDFLFWEYSEILLVTVVNEYDQLKRIAFHILPEVEKMYWRSAIVQVQEETIVAITSRVSIIKQQFNFVTLNTPKHMTSAEMQNLIGSIPLNFTLNEAQNFEDEDRACKLTEATEQKNKNTFWSSVLNLLPKYLNKNISENVLSD